MLSLSCSLGEKPVEDQDVPVGDDRSGIEIAIENGLERTDIVEIWIDPSSEPWSENRIDRRIAPDGEFIMSVDEADRYDIQVIDEDGESYTLQDQNIGRDGFQWTVTSFDADWNVAAYGETTVTIVNGLGNKPIWYVYGTLSSSDAWGGERLDYVVLEPGESFSFDVESGDYYDFYARSRDSNFYFSFDNYVGDDEFIWIISASDLDNSIYEDETHGASSPVTLINRLGNVSILYAFEAETNGEFWGDDLLEGDALSPGDVFTFYLQADRFYDFQVEDEYGNTYTLWEVSVKDNGIFWEVTRDDMDE